MILSIDRRLDETELSQLGALEAVDTVDQIDLSA